MKVFFALSIYLISAPVLAIDLKVDDFAGKKSWTIQAPQNQLSTFGASATANNPGSNLGENKTLVVMLNFKDAKVFDGLKSAQIFNNDDVANVFFGPGPNSVDGFYRETSYNKIWFTGDVIGPISTEISTSDNCDFYDWGSTVDSILANSKVNVGQFDHTVYVFPFNSNCHFGGVAIIGGRQSWLNGAVNLYIAAHELGHNLGLNHASTLTEEYGDGTDVMGFTTAQVNGPHRLQLGLTPSSQVVDLTKNGNFHLSPIELSPDQITNPQILTYQTPDGCALYFSYRQPIGRDQMFQDVAEWKPFVEGVSVHKQCSTFNTYLLQTLHDGDVYQNGLITVEQLGHGFGDVELQVTIAPPILVQIVSAVPTDFCRSVEFFVSALNGPDGKTVTLTANAIHPMPPQYGKGDPRGSPTVTTQCKTPPPGDGNHHQVSCVISGLMADTNYYVTAEYDGVSSQPFWLDKLPSCHREKSDPKDY